MGVKATWDSRKHQLACYRVIYYDELYLDALRSARTGVCVEFRSPRLSRVTTADLPQGVSEELEALRRAMAELQTREREILEHRFGINGPPLTQKQVAAIFGLTTNRIYQIEWIAIHNLKMKLGVSSD